MPTVQTERALADSTFADDLEAISRIEAIPNILEVVCRATGMGFAAVARVTKERWIACAVRDEIAFGLEPGGELKVETTICDEIRDTGQLVVINHASKDQIYCNHPTPKMYGFQGYISVPIYNRRGQFFGTLCAIDPNPAVVNTPETIGMFKLFADLIGFHLDAQERLKLSETALLDERHTAQLREQFIAVLGHDLRNPLNAITGGAKLLGKLPLDEKAMPIVTMVQRSAARMAGLIENVMDFARGRLGGGLSLNRVVDSGMQEVLDHVIAEARTAWPQRTIQSEMNLGLPVICDSARIGQMFSNLLMNAILHGEPDSPIRVSAFSEASNFRISVTNRCEPIEPEILERLFLPFSRGTGGLGQEGLGLGLYIASEIARAHDGILEVASSADETSFTFTMPVAR
ncbi:MAG: GAF domain-containing sensor histidine kinase [bacterium]